jgi:putative SOS response-associated peptidase YedK
MVRDLLIPSVTDVSEMLDADVSQDAFLVDPLHCVNAGERLLGMYTGRGDRRVLAGWRWGFDPDKGRLHLGKLEHAATKPAWATPFAYNRCVIPVQGFVCEGASRRVHFFEENQIILIGGIYKSRKQQAAILTVPAKGIASEWVGRMPLILSNDGMVDRWLDPTNLFPEQMSTELFSLVPDLVAHPLQAVG